MGRRSLPKIDPQLDVSRHLRPEESLPELVSAASLLGRAQPWSLEIGSGKGLFLRSAAQQSPDQALIGIEIAAKYARYAAAGLARLQLSNACCIQGDAQRIVRERVAGESVLAVHVYFPDPWWKKRHRRRRIMNEAFVRDIARILVSEGRLHFWTDVEEYFHSTVELVNASTTLHGPLPVPEAEPEHNLDYRTHFERRMRLNQEAVYRAEWTKRGASSE